MGVFLMGPAQRKGDGAQSFVSGPQLSAAQSRRSAEVRIDVADAPTHQSVLFNECQGLLVCGHVSGWQGPQEAQDCASGLEVAASDFAQHKRVDQDLRLIQRIDQFGIAMP